MTSSTRSFIPLSERDTWHAALTAVDHAFAHTWDSCHAMQLTTGWPTFLYVYESRVATFVCPIAERTFSGATDVVTPYGFSGFVGRGPTTGVLDDWSDFARERGYVCGYIGLHPVLHDGVSADDCRADSHNEVFVLDLRPDDATRLASMSTNRKREVARATRNDVPLIGDRARLSAAFLDLYPDFMASRGAASAYEFTRATLEHIVSLDNVMLVGAGDAENIESVAVFAHTPAVADYLFGVSRPGGPRHSGVLIWEGARRLRELGTPVLNLGGGVRMGDGVSAFKRRFGTTPVSLRRVRQVYDRDRFDALCRGAGVDPADWSGYFPPYRAPGAR